jgi:S1-C subfamily serine protease
MTKTPESQSETTATPQTGENNITQETTTEETLQENLSDTQMQHTQEQPPLDASTSDIENKHCIQCGEFLENTYCKYCGTFNGLEEATFAPIDSIPPPVEPLHSKSRGRRQKSRNTTTAIVALLAICLLAGSFIGYALTYSMFNDKFDALQNQLSSTQQSFSGLNDRLNILQSQLQLAQVSDPKSGLDVDLNSNDNNIMDLSTLYQNVSSSVVVIQCIVPVYNWFGLQVSNSTQQGSGFVVTSNGQQVIVTNNHVIASGSSITVTFADSSSYAATVLGSDAYADLAILKVTNMPNGVPSLPLISSSTLNVGDAVVAVGSPYGLTGTLTAGIISALGRTITETIANNRAIIIPDIIQTTAEINSGNSGGPLINYKGQVVGITTATVSNSQGLGFAISSDTIMREIDTLINTGKYTQHPTINASGRDMTLQLAQSMGITTTYGWLVDTAAESSGLKSGDIIIKTGTTAITNIDDLLTYLVRNTLPGQNVEFTVIRNGQQQTITVHIVALTS